MKKIRTDEDIYAMLREAEMREERKATVAKTQAEKAEHHRKAESARNCRLHLQNKGYQRLSGGSIVAKASKKDQRQRIKALLGRSGM